MVTFPTFNNLRLRDKSTFKTLSHTLPHLCQAILKMFSVYLLRTFWGWMWGGALPVSSRGRKITHFTLKDHVTAGPAHLPLHRPQIPLGSIRWSHSRRILIREFCWDPVRPIGAIPSELLLFPGHCPNSSHVCDNLLTCSHDSLFIDEETETERCCLLCDQKLLGGDGVLGFSGFSDCPCSHCAILPLTHRQ